MKKVVKISAFGAGSVVIQQSANAVVIKTEGKIGIDHDDEEPKNYEKSKFNKIFASELSKVPPELHEKVSAYVHHHVEA